MRPKRYPDAKPNRDLTLTRTGTLPLPLSRHRVYLHPGGIGRDLAERDRTFRRHLVTGRYLRVRGGLGLGRLRLRPKA